MLERIPWPYFRRTWRAPLGGDGTRARSLRTSETRQVLIFTGAATMRLEGPASVAARLATISGPVARGVALVLWGNETRAQLASLQARLSLHRHPFVSESGGGLFLPRGCLPNVPANARAVAGYDVIDFGWPHREVASTLHEMADRLGVHIVGLTDVSVEDVAKDQHVSLAQARLATLREYDEPFRIVDDRPDVRSRLIRALRRAGLHCFSTEDFHRVTGVADRIESLRALTRLYRHAFRQVLTVGLASTSSELDLLRAVDVPVVVHRGTGDSDALLEAMPQARLTGVSGSPHWASTIAELFDPPTS